MQSAYPSAYRSTSSPPPSKRPKRPNKLFRACVQCVTSKTRCEDVLSQGCSVCRRKGKDCSLAGAIVEDEADVPLQQELRSRTGDPRDPQQGRAGEWSTDDRGFLHAQRASTARATSGAPTGSGVMYPPMHPIRHSISEQGGQAQVTYGNGSALHKHGDSAGAEELHERIVQSETRIRQLEDRVSTLQSLALSQQSSYPASIIGGGASGAQTQPSSAAISPFQTSLSDYASMPNRQSATFGQSSTDTDQAENTARSRADPLAGLAAATDHITAIRHSHRRQQPALIANVHSRYTYSFNGGWIVSAYTPPSSFCLLTQGHITMDEVEVAWTAFQQNMATRLPLGIWASTSATTSTSGSGSLGLALGDVVTDPAEHPYLVIAMLHHVSPYNKRKLRGYSLAQAADEVVGAALKPLSRARGDSTLEVLAALLVLSLAPTLPDVVGAETEDPDNSKEGEGTGADKHNLAHSRQIATEEVCVPRPSSVKYAAMALQLGRDSGLQAEVENIIKTAGDDLARPEWGEAYMKVELWQAIVSVYNLLQTMQSHRAPTVPCITPLLPPAIRSLNPDLYDLTRAREEMARLGSACSGLLDRIENDCPPEAEAKELVKAWRSHLDRLVSGHAAAGDDARVTNRKLDQVIQLDRDCVAQALIVRLAMLIQHLPSPLAPLRAALMPQMGSIHSCAETMFRHVVPDDHLAAIKASRAASRPAAKNPSESLNEHTHAIPPSASPLLRVPAYVAQCTLLGYMTMQGTVAFMRGMIVRARQQRRRLSLDGARGPSMDGHEADMHDARDDVQDGDDKSLKGERGRSGAQDASTAKRGTYGLKNTASTRTPTRSQARGSDITNASSTEIEAELAKLMDMTRFDEVALRLRQANGVYGVILNSLNVMHGVAEESVSDAAIQTSEKPREQRQGLWDSEETERKGAIGNAAGDSGGTHGSHGQGATAAAPSRLVGTGGGLQATLPGNGPGTATQRQEFPPGQASAGVHLQPSTAQYPAYTDTGLGTTSIASEPFTNQLSQQHYQQYAHPHQHQHQPYQPQLQMQVQPVQPLLQPFGFDPNLTMGGLFDTDLSGWDLLNMGSEWEVPFFGQGDVQGQG